MVKWYHMALLMLRSEFDSLCPDHIKTHWMRLRECLSTDDAGSNPALVCFNMVLDEQRGMGWVPGFALQADSLIGSIPIFSTKQKCIR
jgi:hypothetical protein